MQNHHNPTSIEIRAHRELYLYALCTYNGRTLQYVDFEELCSTSNKIFTELLNKGSSFKVEDFLSFKAHLYLLDSEKIKEWTKNLKLYSLNSERNKILHELLCLDIPLSCWKNSLKKSRTLSVNVSSYGEILFPKGRKSPCPLSEEVKTFFFGERPKSSEESKDENSGSSRERKRVKSKKNVNGGVHHREDLIWDWADKNELSDHEFDGLIGILALRHNITPDQVLQRINEGKHKFYMMIHH